MSARRHAFLRFALLALITGGFLFPLAWTGLASLGIVPDNSSRPPSWTGPATLVHFAEIGLAEPTFWQELATSTVTALVAACLAVAVAFPAAFALARSRRRGSRTLTQGFLVLASLPVMAYVIPLSDISRRLHLIDTLAGVTLSEAAVTAPLAVFVLHGALVQLPTDWEEAAVMDGAGLVRILVRVVLPLVIPSVAATLVVMFVLDWNMLLVPLVLTSGDVKTIPVALSDFFTFERELDWPTAAAALLVSLAPLALLVAFFHRALESFALQAPASRDIG
jgi:ABC-type glycerol-3-phosphate transport system permease component